MPTSKARAAYTFIEAAFANAPLIPLQQQRVVEMVTLADINSPGTFLSSGMVFTFEHPTGGPAPATYAEASNAEYATISNFYNLESKLDMVDMGEEVREYVEAQNAARTYIDGGIGFLRVSRIELAEDPESGLFSMGLDWEAGGFH